jgi:hypothetical protein
MGAGSPTPQPIRDTHFPRQSRWTTLRFGSGPLRKPLFHVPEPSMVFEPEAPGHPLHGPLITVDPPREVLVLNAGECVPGWLTHWRRYDDGWHATSATGTRTASPAPTSSGGTSGNCGAGDRPVVGQFDP